MRLNRLCHLLGLRKYAIVKCIPDNEMNKELLEKIGKVDSYCKDTDLSIEEVERILGYVPIPSIRANGILDAAKKGY